MNTLLMLVDLLIMTMRKECMCLAMIVKCASCKGYVPHPAAVCSLASMIMMIMMMPGGSLHISVQEKCQILAISQTCDLKKRCEVQCYGSKKV